MRIFLTGGTGFIGAHVMSAALAAGHEVRALRRSETSIPFIPLPGQPVWCMGDMDSLKPAWFADVDAVLHLTSVGVSPKKASWSDLVQVNVVGSLRLMELASKIGVSRFVVAGTCHEYGNAALRYDAIPPNAALDPMNAYGASKAAAFQLLRTYAIEQRLELCYCRIFTAYGEGQYEGNFWPSLRRAALAGDDFLMTSGMQISDFIPVASVAIHLLEACSRTDINPGVPLVFNIGSGVPRTLLSFAQAEWERLGASGRLLPASLPDRPDQIERYVPDICGLRILENFSTTI